MAIGARPPGRPSASFPLIARCRPVNAWPAADRIAWQTACDPGGRLSQPGPAAHLAPDTRSKRWKEWGRFLSYLDVAGDLDPAETPDQRLTPQRLGGYIMSSRGRIRASSTHCRVVDLKAAIRAMCPTQEWSWVTRHPAMPRAAEVAASHKPIDPPDAAELMAAALNQCDAADRLAPHTMASWIYRDGLMIAFNVWATLRRRNLAEMEIGRHLLIGERHLRIVFDDSIKNGEIIDSLIPEFLGRYFRGYLDRHRPVLLRGDTGCTALWINKNGTPLASAALRAVFQQNGRRLIGRPINVHSTRHALATSLMDADPRNLRLASAALTHRGATSVNGVYDRSGTRSASRIWSRIRGRHQRYIDPAG